MLMSEKRKVSQALIKQRALYAVSDQAYDICPAIRYLIADDITNMQYSLSSFLTETIPMLLY